MNAEVDLTDTRMETERLLIRPWKNEDLEDFYRYASVDGVGQMAGWKPHKSINESKVILNSFIDGKNEFALELKENHKVIGSLGLECLSIPLDAPYDKYIGREIGYVLSKEYWGQSLMAEAVKSVIDFCFYHENYDFLLCCHFDSNTQSKKVIEKCGFRFVKENTRTWADGTEHTSLYYLLDRPGL